MTDPSDITIAYLCNQYPKVSHSFVRREIVALEKRGVRVLRYAIRPSSERLVDAADLAERKVTDVILDVGLGGLFAALLRVACTRPRRWLHAFGLAMRLGFRSDRGLLRHMAYLAEACVLEARLRHSGAKHLHAHFGTNSAMVALLCREIGGPTYSFTTHGTSEFDRPTSISLGEKLERARFAVAVSKFGRSQLYRWCGHGTWPRIHVVHCGVDDSFFQHDPIPVPQRPRLVCVGRLSTEKGQLLLIEAADQLKSDGMQFELVLVGDGDLRRPLEERIRAYDLHDTVRITGWATGDEVQRRLQESRALVLPSFSEGLPVVLMEAFAMARPVIATCVGGIPELVRDGENGWLICAGSVDELAEAMRQVLVAPLKKLNAMGQAGRQRVRADHYTTTLAHKLETLFRNCVAPQPAGHRTGLKNSKSFLSLNKS